VNLVGSFYTAISRCTVNKTLNNHNTTLIEDKQRYVLLRQVVHFVISVYRNLDLQLILILEAWVAFRPIACAYK